MAIVACQECSKDISSGAESCPHCGFQIVKPESHAWKTGGSLLCALLLGVSGCNGIAAMRAPGSGYLGSAAIAVVFLMLSALFWPGLFSRR